MKASKAMDVTHLFTGDPEPPELEIGETTRVDQGVAAESAAPDPLGILERITRGRVYDPVVKGR